MLSAILSLVMVSQNCPGGICPTSPGYGPAIVMQPVLSYYRIKDAEGWQFNVLGRMGANGVVTYNPSEPYNVRALAHLKEAKAKQNPPTKPKDLARPPVAEPAKQWQTHGVPPEHRMSGHREKYYAVSPEAKDFVERAKENSKEPAGAPTSRPKVSVTIIGNQEDRQKAVNDFKSHPAFESVRGRVNFQSYDPNDWAVSPALGFKPGKPAIYVQTGRRVAWRTMDYSTGPERFAAVVIEELRKADPGYNPDKDPGIAAACPFGFTNEHLPLVVLTGVAIGAVLLTPRKGS